MHNPRPVGAYFWCPPKGCGPLARRHIERPSTAPPILQGGSSIQNEIGNRHSPTVIAAAITSRLDKTRLPTHINIRAADTGLAKDSVVLLEQIRTLDKHRLRQRAGQITPEDQKRVNQALDVSLGVSKNDTLQGEPISARSRGTEIPSPWYPPGDKI